MGEMGEPPTTGVTAAEILGQIPIMRGWDGREDADNWSTVGTGLYLAKVAGLQAEVETGDLDKEWEKWGELLSPEFVDFVRDGGFERFECRGCGASI